MRSVRRGSKSENRTATFSGIEVPVYRPSVRRRLLVAPLVFLVKLWGRTLRLRFEEGAVERCRSIEKPALFLFWHNHIFLAVVAKRRFQRPYPLSAIASTSRDGAWPAAVFAQAGVTIIRGSSHTRGERAAREMLAVHRADHDLCLTPDGSRGPRYHLRPGAVFLSKKAGSPLLLFGATFHRAWRLRSWDRFFLPKPFSRVDLRVRKIEAAELAAIPDEEEARAFLEARLRAITEDPEETPDKTANDR